MKIVRILYSLCFVMLLAEPALGYSSNGRINSNVTYKYFQIVNARYRPHMTGTLESTTDKPVIINGTIRLHNIHGELIDSAKIYKTIPPYGSIDFNMILTHSNYNTAQSAYDIVWDLKEYPDKTKPRKKHKTEHEKPTGYSTTRALDSYVKVSGKGRHNSEHFKLKAGTYIVKTEYTGKRHIMINLLRKDRTLKKLIAEGVGNLSEYQTLHIDKDDDFYLNIYSFGSWMVSFELQNETSQKALDDTNKGEEPRGLNCESTGNPVIITLKNGNTLKADSYWDDGDKIRIAIFGNTMSLYKKDIQKIANPSPH